MMSLGDRIRELLHAHGYSQTELSKYLGKSNSFVSQILNGKAPINTDNLSAICDFLDISLSEFFQPFHKNAALTPAVSALIADCRKLSSSDAEATHFFVKHLLKKNEEVAHALTLSTIDSVSVVRTPDASEDSDEEEETDEDEEPKYYLPLLGGAAAGSPIYHPADDGDQVAVPEKYSDPDRYAVFQARGDSMEPRIPNGAFIVTEVNVLPADGEVAVVMLSSFSDAEYVVKRVYRKRNSAILRSYNPKYTDMEVAADEVRSAYRMVEIIR